MLSKINPLNSVFGRVFLFFWGTVILIIGAVLFINQQLSTIDEVRPIDKLQKKLLFQASSTLEDTARYDIRLVAKKLERKFRHTRIVLKDADTGLLVFPRSLPDKKYQGVISNLSLKSSPLQIKQERSTIIGPLLIKRGEKSYQLMLITRNRHSDSLWIQLWKMPLWLKLVLLMLVTLVPCWLIARNIAQPISKLRQGSQTLARGELQYRLNDFTHRQDEIGHLASDFNHMADKLSSMVNLYKRLLADVSHELRTPLTRLELTLAMAQKNPADNQKELRRAEQELHKLDDIIGNVLRLAKLENHEVSIKQDDIDLVELIRLTVNSCQLEAQGKGIRIQTQLADELTIIGDEILLSFAFDNILRNAIKYSPANSNVSITMKVLQQTISVVVLDQGPGVKTSELPQLFTPFFRGLQAQQESKGAGLGLAIAKKAVSRHGGKIEAENQEPSGLKVTITLPT